MPRLLGAPAILALALVCLAMFYAGDAVVRLPRELRNADQPQWIPIARVLVFGTVCWVAVGWLRRAIRRARPRRSGDTGAAT